MCSLRKFYVRLVKLRSRKLCLISTDKAVRPTNIMGAQRLAELIVQFYAQSGDSFEEDKK